ncbi:unnamed protein product [Paramecium sonneborni]|uniref:Protein kinase domain-containing protein n=1 Tax=Paramecium sonneborni TaxID=65129 RepID=A0A8S1P673_9CILI|nr:unnamed protein product [Paramecium sonneborni]
MNYQSQKFDREKCSKDSRILSILETGEQILLSTCLWKFSHINKQQERILVITNKNLYNITPQSTLVNFFSKVVSSVRVKRKIAIQQVDGITISKCGFEFVIHVPDEYDYRYSSLDFREKILFILSDAYNKLLNKNLKIYLTDDLTLIPHTKTKVDAKKGIQKMHRNHLNIDPQSLVNYDFSTMKQNEDNQKQLIRKSYDYYQQYKLLKYLYQGMLGQVIMVQNIKTEKYYVFKLMQKQDVITTDHLNHTQIERKLLEIFDHPFIIKLVQAFETDDQIIFVLPFYQGGDLYTHLKRESRLKEERVKFIISQLILAIGYMHEREYVYRDLKPENILLDSDGYVVLTDLGLCKQLPNNDQSYSFTYSFTGSVEYIAPEMITAIGYNRMIDWWMLGILTYELIFGITPFYSDNQSQMFESIQEREVRFSTNITISNDCKDFINNLLKKEPKERLGYKKDSFELKAHLWLKDVNFTEILKKTNQIWKLNLNDPLDLRFFESEDFNLESFNSLQQDKTLIQKFNQVFQNIEFNL